MLRRVLLIAAVLSVTLPTVACAGSRIDGTYVLVSRTLPDGTVQTPPAVQGLMTFGDGMRNTNVFWRDAQGRGASASGVAKFDLTEYSYTETNVFFMRNAPDQSGIAYDLSDLSQTSEVVYTEKGLRFDLPMHDEPVVEFSKDGFTATLVGQFVDRWRRIEKVREDEAKAREAQEKAAKDAAEAEKKAAEDTAKAEEPQK